MQNVYTKVYIESEVLDNLRKALVEVPEKLNEVVAAAAAMHVAFTMEKLPAEVQGKTKVEVYPHDSGNGVIIEYQPKSGEPGTIVASNRSLFIPEENLGEFSSATRTFTRSGDVGRFMNRLQVTGRPSIEIYLAVKLQEASAIATDKTHAEIESMVRAELVNSFAKHNIHFNAALGRYVAGAGGAYLPHTGVFYPGGQIIAGVF